MNSEDAFGSRAVVFFFPTACFQLITLLLIGKESMSTTYHSPLLNEFTLEFVSIQKYTIS